MLNAVAVAAGLLAFLLEMRPARSTSALRRPARAAAAFVRSLGLHAGPVPIWYCGPEGEVGALLAESEQALVTSTTPNSKKARGEVRDMWHEFLSGDGA